MAFQKFIRTTVQADEPVITIGDNKFHYSATFTKLAELNKYSFVEYFVDEESRQIGFKYYDNNETRDCVTLTVKTGSTYYRSSAGDLISRYSWVKKVASMKSTDDRKFIAKQRQGLWVIQLAPAFEVTILRSNAPKNLPDDSGIYRYRNDKDQIVYIGKGNIKTRYSMKDRKDWNFSSIDYSIVKGDENQLEWESYWIERFKETNSGFLPYYNKVSGHKRIQGN